MKEKIVLLISPYEELVNKFYKNTLIMFNLPSNIIFKSLIYNDEENNIIEKIKDLKKENKFDKGVFLTLKDYRSKEQINIIQNLIILDGTLEQMEIINIGESGNMEPNKDDFEQELIELSKKINNC